MNPGMKMLAATMARKRDSRGRYMEDDGGARMEYDGNQGNYSRMEGETEMRRRRDSRGRYMEGAPSAHYMPWPEPHIPPYGDEPEMRVNDGRRMEQRKIGFGANAEEDESDAPTMRRRRDSRGRYAEDDHRQPEMRHGNVSYFPRPQNNAARMHHGGSSGEGQKVEAGGTFWMIPPTAEKLTREKAEKWVRSMHSDDPKSHGEMWTYEDAKTLAEERGLPTEGQDMIDFYVALNMVYNDYCKVAKEHGVDTEDYFADLAQAWLYDRDGKPPTEKLMAYKKYVVPHGEE